MEMFSQLLALCDGNPLVIDEYPSQSVEWTLLLLLTWAYSWTYSSVAWDLKRNSALVCSIVYDRISNRWSVRCFDHAYPIVPHRRCVVLVTGYCHSQYSLWGIVLGYCKYVSYCLVCWFWLTYFTQNIKNCISEYMHEWKDQNLTVD